MPLQKYGKKAEKAESKLAEKIMDTLEHKKSNFHVLYEDDLSLTEKMKRSPKKFTEPRGLFMSRQQENSLQRSKRWDLDISRSVWRRTSTLCQMMRKSWDARKTLTFIFGKCMSAQEQDLLLH